MKFEDGHTHVNNFYIAKSIIYYCINQRVSNKSQHLLKHKYIVTSIIRVIDDENEKNNLKKRLEIYHNAISLYFDYLLISVH